MSTPLTVIRHSHPPVRDLDSAQRLAEELYGKVVISFPRGTDRLCWQLERHSVGSMTLIAAEHNLNGEIRTDALESHYVLASLRRGAMEMSARRRSVGIVPRERAAILHPGTDAGAAWSAGILSLNVLVTPEALQACVSALTGTPLHEAPVFEMPLDMRSGPGADLRGILDLFHTTCTRTDGPPPSPHVLAHLREALYSGLLFAAESSVSHLVRNTPPLPCRRSVRMVEEYLTAHASEPISLTDLAGVTGVGLRSLQRAFRSVHGMSPRAFLTNARLELARRHLVAAPPGTTVAQVLYASGFGHAGEFSRAYRRRFGESPSDTLRRAASEQGTLPSPVAGP